MNRKKTSIHTAEEKAHLGSSGQAGQQNPAELSHSALLRLHNPLFQVRDNHGDPAEAESRPEEELPPHPMETTGIEGQHLREMLSGEDLDRTDPPVPVDGSGKMDRFQPTERASKRVRRHVPSLRDALAETKKELRKTTGNLGRLSEYLRTLLNNIPIPLLIVGRDYHLRYASREAQRMLNLGSFEPGIRVTDTMLSLHIPRLRKLLTDVLEGGQAVEREIQNEEDRWYRVLFQPYEVPRMGVDGIVVTLFDVDVQKRVEMLLEAEQRRISLMMDAIGGIFVVLDPDGIISQVNKCGCELLGYSEQEMVGTNWFDTYVVEASRSDARNACHQPVSRVTRQPASSEILVTARNGEQRLLRWHTTRLADNSGSLRGLFGVGEDITLWRAAQVSALESEERFRLLMGMEPESDFLTSDPSGYVTNWYAGSGPARKFSAHEVIGKHISMFFPPEDFLAGKPMRLLRMAETRGRYEENGWCVDGDGSRHRAKFVVLPVRGPGGNVTGFAGVIRLLGEYSWFPRC